MFAKDELCVTSVAVFNCCKLVQSNTKLSNVGVFTKLGAEKNAAERVSKGYRKLSNVAAFARLRGNERRRSLAIPSHLATW